VSINGQRAGAATDVLVVGGGPAGLATAISCTLAGLSVIVAEPRTAPIDKACGEGLMPSTVTRLAAIGVHPVGHPLRGIRYLDSGHSADAHFRHGCGLGVRRTTFHDTLAARAAELAIPVLPVKVTEFAQHSGGVTAAGIEARYLVAADGLHSGIRRACGLDPPPPRYPRFGLRKHYRLAPWTDLVEVYWASGQEVSEASHATQACADSEAYVTPVADDLVGVAVLGSAGGDFETRLAAFPALQERLAGAPAASAVRGAGPLRQDVRCRTFGRVLFVGDASGYLDALTGEGIGLALAHAAVLAECLAADRVGDYERAWRRVSRKAWVLTSGLLWARHQTLLAERIVPAAQRLPRVFNTIVNQVGQA
jgi:flavin-dependent dehydrogenase